MKKKTMKMTRLMMHIDFGVTYAALIYCKLNIGETGTTLSHFLDGHFSFTAITLFCTFYSVGANSY